MHDLSYHERLQALGLYSLRRRRERYCIILIWKIIENKSQTLSDPILCNFSDRRGGSCVISHVNTGRQGTLAYNSFRWRAIRLFNSLPKSICDITNCSVCNFKQRLVATSTVFLISPALLDTTTVWIQQQSGWWRLHTTVDTL